MVVPIHPAGPLVPSYATQPLEAQVEVGQWFWYFLSFLSQEGKNMFSPFCKLERRFAFEPIVNKDLIEIKIARNFTLRRCCYLSFTTYFNVAQFYVPTLTFRAIDLYRPDGFRWTLASEIMKLDLNHLECWIVSGWDVAWSTLKERKKYLQRMPEVTGSHRRAWLDGEANDDRGKIRAGSVPSQRLHILWFASCNNKMSVYLLLLSFRFGNFYDKHLEISAASSSL